MIGRIGAPARCRTPWRWWPRNGGSGWIPTGLSPPWPSRPLGGPSSCSSAHRHALAACPRDMQEESSMAGQPLAGQKALVTGASSGIGEAVAMALGAAGADVAVNYITNPEVAEAV